MSRFQDWNRAWSGIATYLSRQGLVLDIRCVKGKKDRYIGVEVPKIVRRYCKNKKIQGSLTSMYLQVSKDFEPFKEWVKTADLSKYKD
jgi:hypothetical protein